MPLPVVPAIIIKFGVAHAPILTLKAYHFVYSHYDILEKVYNHVSLMSDMRALDGDMWLKVVLTRGFGLSTIDAYKVLAMIAGTSLTWGTIFEKMENLKKMRAAEDSQKNSDLHVG